MEEPQKLFLKESRLRSLVKAFVYRSMATVGTGILIWLLTKDIKGTISITIIVQVFLIILYYLNERVWNKINWGKKIQSEKTENCLK
jgi:uncharacterized membrane protein